MTSKRAIYRLEALKNWFKEDSEQYISIDKAIKALQHVESVGEKTDCVEVVRCKDCKHYAKETDGLAMPMYICKRFTEWEIDETENLELAMKPDDFCSYGERKEE